MSSIDVTFSKITPTAPTNTTNVEWQTDGASSPHISANVPNMTATQGGLTPTPPNDATQFLDGAANYRTLIATDIPSLDASKITTSQIALAQGGTGVDLSTSGGTTKVLAQDASHNISARNLVAADIPSLDASIITTGKLALTHGGANADLSATGGPSQVLKQVASGAAITVGQLATTDLSDFVQSTYTPTLTGFTVTNGALVATGQYWHVGKLVFFNVQISNPTGSSGTYDTTGGGSSSMTLPVTQSANDGLGGVGTNNNDLTSNVQLHLSNAFFQTLSISWFKILYVSGFYQST